jgi:hypothetical protein
MSLLGVALGAMASLAQLAKHVLRKRMVMGSIPTGDLTSRLTSVTLNVNTSVQRSSKNQDMQITMLEQKLPRAQTESHKHIHTEEKNTPSTRNKQDKVVCWSPRQLKKRAETHAPTRGQSRLAWPQPCLPMTLCPSGQEKRESTHRHTQTRPKSLFFG